MPVDYILVKSNVVKGKYTARTLSKGWADYDHVVDEMLNRGSSTTRTDILAVLNEYQEALVSLLLRGEHVNTPFLRYEISIKGVFEGANDQYDGRRHEPVLKIHPGPAFRRAIKTCIQFHKQKRKPVLPRPVIFNDMESGEENGRITPGGMAEVIGTFLQFNPDDPDQGIFFVDGSKERFPVIGRPAVKPGRLNFLIPDLAPGEYHFIIRGNCGTGLVREGELGRLLTVDA